ncbi:hypothetical protein [Frankia sp. CcI49]|nr:hypothetical protein [Frankia sp. CcI49]
MANTPEPMTLRSRQNFLAVAVKAGLLDQTGPYETRGRHLRLAHTSEGF